MSESDSNFDKFMSLVAVHYRAAQLRDQTPISCQVAAHPPGWGKDDANSEINERMATALRTAVEREPPCKTASNENLSTAAE